MTTGTVKFFNEGKGYGFIAPDGGGNDAFVHITAVERSGMRTLPRPIAESRPAGRFRPRHPSPAPPTGDFSLPFGTLGSNPRQGVWE